MTEGGMPPILRAPRSRPTPPQDEPEPAPGGGGTSVFWVIIGCTFLAIGATIGGGSLSNRAFVFYVVGLTFVFLAWKGRVERDAGRGPRDESLPDEVDPRDHDDDVADAAGDDDDDGQERS